MSASTTTTPAASAPTQPSPPPGNWQLLLSRSMNMYYYAHPTSGERLWPLETKELSLIDSSSSSLVVDATRQQWGWKLQNPSSTARVYMNMMTGTSITTWPPPAGATVLAPPSTTSSITTTTTATDSEKNKKRQGHPGGENEEEEGEDEYNGEEENSSKRKRNDTATASASSSSSSSSSSSTTVFTSLANSILPPQMVNKKTLTVSSFEEAPALKPPSELDVSDIHLGKPHATCPEGVQESIIPKEYIEAVRDLCRQKPARSIGLPVDMPETGPFHHGWFFPPHKVVLHELLNPQTKLILELGCWLGKSLLFMAERASNALIVTIDLWDNTFIYNTQGDHYCRDERQLHLLKTRPLYETFICNGWDLRHRLIPMKMSTEDGVKLVAEVFGKHGIAPDLIYIDADHHYEPAKRDIEACMRAFPNAHIVGDDYDYPDVRRAAHELGVKYGRKVHAEQSKCWTFSNIVGLHRDKYSGNGGGGGVGGSNNAGGGGGAGGAVEEVASVIAANVAEKDRGLYLEFSQEIARLVERENSETGIEPFAMRSILAKWMSRLGGGSSAIGAGQSSSSSSSSSSTTPTTSKFFTWISLPLDVSKGKGKCLTALQAAARFGATECTRELVSPMYRVNLDSILGKGRSTALGIAAFYGHTEIVRLLLQGGADKGIKNQYGELPIDSARKEKRNAIVALLS